MLLNWDGTNYEVRNFNAYTAQPLPTTWDAFTTGNTAFAGRGPSVGLAVQISRTAIYDTASVDNHFVLYQSPTNWCAFYGRNITASDNPSTPSDNISPNSAWGMGDLVIIASMGTPNANNYELRSGVQFPSSSGATIPTVDGSATPQIFRSGYLTNRNVSDFTVTDTPSTTDDLWFTQNTNRTISTNASLTARFPPVAGNVTWALSGTLADALHASPPLIISSTNVPNPGTRGFLMDSSGVGIINAGILNVNDITIQGTISSANLDTGVTVQTRSGSLASLARNSPR